MMTLEKMLCLL